MRAARASASAAAVRRSRSWRIPPAESLPASIAVAITTHTATTSSKAAPAFRLRRLVPSMGTPSVGEEASPGPLSSCAIGHSPPESQPHGRRKPLERTLRQQERTVRGKTSTQSREIRDGAGPPAHRQGQSPTRRALSVSLRFPPPGPTSPEASTSTV